jgi:hypothetical protein
MLLNNNITVQVLCWELVLKNNFDGFGCIADILQTYSIIKTLLHEVMFLVVFLQVV